MVKLLPLGIYWLVILLLWTLVSPWASAILVTCVTSFQLGMAAQLVLDIRSEGRSYR